MMMQHQQQRQCVSAGRCSGGGSGSSTASRRVAAVAHQLCRSQLSIRCKARPQAAVAVAAACRQSAEVGAAASHHHHQQQRSPRWQQVPHQFHGRSSSRVVKHAAVAVAAAQEQQPVSAAAEEDQQLPSAGADVGSPPPHTTTSTTTTATSTDSSGSSSSDSSSSSDGEDAAAAVSSEQEAAASPPSLQVHIKVLSEQKELEAVARLRAEAYYEHDRSRFATSFKKQFAAQEVESLRQRTAPTSSAQRPQLCDCLVALEAGGAVVACIDIRLPQSSTRMQTIGVPDGDASGCYLLNVVVSEAHRGLGVGKQVMRAAMSRAVHHWGAQRLYTHVEADNEVANRLYRSCGYEEHSSEAKYANTSSLGRLVLLMAAAEHVERVPTH